MVEVFEGRVELEMGEHWGPEWGWFRWCRHGCLLKRGR